MSNSDRLGIDSHSPPLDQFDGIRLLAGNRSGRDSAQHARHLLYTGRDRRTATNVLIKVTSKPGLVYEHNLANEIACLTTINRELPDSSYFPVIRAQGRLRDDRFCLVSSLFDELPLATTIDTQRTPGRMVLDLRTAMEVARALAQLHGLQIFHVDLNPMNILYRWEKGRPLIRIVDFESSYESARHATGGFYDPPLTPGYAAPEVPRQAPDQRADLFSLGAVLYTLLAGYEWTWGGEVDAAVEADRELDPELKEILRCAVNRSPDRRFPSIDAFRTALGAYLEGIWPGRSW